MILMRNDVEEQGVPKAGFMDCFPSDPKPVKGLNNRHLLPIFSENSPDYLKIGMFTGFLCYWEAGWPSLHRLRIPA
jgi:hypothetical protein